MYNYFRQNETKPQNKTEPIVLNVEYLMVADADYINKNKILMESQDETHVFLLMKAYFAHLINGVTKD
jgi:hypothetical protein